MSCLSQSKSERYDTSAKYDLIQDKRKEIQRQQQGQDRKTPEEYTLLEQLKQEERPRSIEQANKQLTSLQHRTQKRNNVARPKWFYVSIGLAIIFILIMTVGFLIKNRIINPGTTQTPGQILPKKNKWKQLGITVAGGNGGGNQSNQLDHPCGFFIDDHKTIFIADYWNNRIVKWKYDSKNGEIIAGGHGSENQINQLYSPRDLIADKQNNAFIICDRGKRRVVRSFHHYKGYQQILISDIDCYGLAMDKNGFIYVSDTHKNEVRRWKIEDKNEQGTLVAGGNGEGGHRNQLNAPTFIVVDEDYSVYISDRNNHRVMKWRKDAKEGIVVAGGNGEGNSLKQLSHPWGIVVDHLRQIYVADKENHRVMRWSEEHTEGSLVAGGYGPGKESNQLRHPSGLSMDAEGNLYVADWENHRIQKFENDFA